IWYAVPFFGWQKSEGFLIQTKLKHRLINNAIKTGVYSNLRPQNLQRRPIQNPLTIEHADLRNAKVTLFQLIFTFLSSNLVTVIRLGKFVLVKV
ncbi:MAG: hypothetical protein O6940_03100, partial [Ignavibacteria bacterium]|nr:hypothetical protein [Ignavibacteria bacterium]